MGASELILYTTEDGQTRIQLRVDHDTVWLTQLEMAELFQASVSSINIHVNNLLEDGELIAKATIKENLIVRQEGGRQVRRSIKL